ncbi:MAG: hypothetical protein ACREH6_00915 [Geminicoccaceae bacterium]
MVGVVTLTGLGLTSVVLAAAQDTLILALVPTMAAGMSRPRSPARRASDRDMKLILDRIAPRDEAPPLPTPGDRIMEGTID